MDNNISNPNRQISTQPTLPTTQTPTPSAKARAILQMVTGPKSERVSELTQKLENTVQRLSGALAEVQVSSEELQPPQLPSSSGSGPGTEHQQRREALKQAEAQTRSGAVFNANEDVTAIFQATRGRLGTDKTALRELFWDRSPEQLRAISETYGDRYPDRDLWKDLERDLGNPRDRQMLASLREGDRVTAASAALVDATTGLGNKGRVEFVLERLAPEEVSLVQERYRQDHPNGRSLQDWTDRNFKNEARDRVTSLLEGDPQSAQISQMQENLRKRNGNEVLAELRSLDPEARKEFVESFDTQAKDGEKLQDRIQAALRGTNRDQALALMEGNDARADAVLIQDAVDGLGSNRTKLWRALGSEIPDPQERREHLERVEAEYDNMYGPESPKRGKSLRARLASELSGEHLERAQFLLGDGEVPAGHQIRYAVSGSKKSGQDLARLVEQHGPDKARELYAEATRSQAFPSGRSLDDDVQSRLGGRGRFEAKTALLGTPETPEDKVARTVERTRFETKGLGGVFTNTDNILVQNTERAQEALENLKAARESGDQEAQKEWTLRIDELTGYASEDTEVFRAEKDGATEVTAGVAAGVAAAVAIGVTGGAAAPAIAVAAGATAGAAANYGVRNVMAGNAYDQGDAMKDLAIGAVEGLGVKGGAVAGRIVREGLDSKVKSVAANRWLGGTLQAAADGAVGGAMLGAADSALGRDTWDDGLGSGLETVVFSTGQGSLFGTAIGGGLGAGLGGISRGGKAFLANDVVSEGGDRVRSMMGRPRSRELPIEEFDQAVIEARKASPPPSPQQQVRNQELWSNRAYLDSQNYRNLDVKQRENFDFLAKAVTETGEQGERAGAALVGMLESGKLLKTTTDGSSVLDNLRSLRENPRLPQVGPEADELFLSTLRIVDNPGAIHQAQRGTCAAATIQFLHATSDPADFVRVMDGLTSQGVVTTKGGFELKVNKSAFEQLGFDPRTGTRIESRMSIDDRGEEVFLASNRGPVSRIYQSTAMDSVGDLVVKGHIAEYDNLIMKIDTTDANGNPVQRELGPEGVGVYTFAQMNGSDYNRGGFRLRESATGDILRDPSPNSPGVVVLDGLRPEQQKGLMSRMLGHRVRAQELAPDALALSAQNPQPSFTADGLTLRDRRAYQAVILGAIKAQKEGVPMTVGLKWGDGGHAVSVMGFTDDGRLLIRNPQVVGRDVWEPGDLSPRRDSDPESIGAALSEAGFSAIEPQEFFRHLRTARVARVPQ